MSPRVTATATATVDIVDRATRRAVRPLLYAAGVVGLLAVVGLARHGVAAIVLAVAVLVLVALAAVGVIVALVVYARQGSTPPAVRVVWAPMTGGVEVTADPAVVGHRSCAACGLPAVRVLRGPSGLHLPVCSIHAAYAADHVRRALITGGAR